MTQQDTDYKYYLKSGNGDWIKVPKSEWIRAERSAGFRPNMSRDHPKYMDTCATGGFSNDYISGKVEYVKQ